VQVGVMKGIFQELDTAVDEFVTQVRARAARRRTVGFRRSDRGRHVTSRRRSGRRAR
jgi:hypothetical protein